MSDRLALLMLAAATVVLGAAALCTAEDPLECELYPIVPVTPDPVPDPEYPCGEPQRIIHEDQASGAPYWFPAPVNPLGVANPSACWHSMVSHYVYPGADPGYPPLHSGFNTDLPVFPTGYRSGFNALGSPSLGDFLAASPTLGGSSIALLPPGSYGLPTGWQGGSRPVLDGTVDLVTGSPLIQSTDLELPFGSAVFRLTRTRSQSQQFAGPQFFTQYGSDSNYRILAQDAWWSWTGLGWMVGENPLLVIDSALPDMVGPNPRTTWLVLDAHHAIPFQQVNLAQDGTGNPRVGYEAPPRFRARMSHNGVWGLVDDITALPPVSGPHPKTYGWIEPPTTYEVWLYDGAVKYTFAAIREDVPPHAFDRGTFHGGDPDIVQSSYHDIALYPEPGTSNHEPWNSLQNPGFGIPYLGVCTRIEDRYGHSVNIFYCDVPRTPIDEGLEECVPCMQRCLRKGQISRIELRSESGGGDRLEWLLIYAHRYFDSPQELGGTFAGAWSPGDPEYDRAHATGAVAIDRIYAYKGETEEADLLAAWLEGDGVCLEIPASDAPYGAFAVDPADSFPQGTRDKWVHKIRYHYQTYPYNAYTHAQEAFTYPPSLIWTNVQSRPEVSASGASDPPATFHRHRFYRYSDPAQFVGVDPDVLPWLERVYTQSDFASLLAWARETIACHSDEECERSVECYELELANRVVTLSPHDFATADYPFVGPNSVEFELEDVHGGKALALLRSFASVDLGSQTETEWPSQASSRHPDPSAMLTAPSGSPYITIDGARLVYDGSQTGTVSCSPGGVSERGGDTARRHYIINRFAVTPVAVPKFSYEAFHRYMFPTPENPWAYTPNRSMYTHPYQWSIGRVGGQSLNEPASLSEPRWVTVVDEFTSREAMLADTSYSGDYATKPEQISRRVVKMNAAGTVLSDKLWEFTGDGVLVSGGGLGEQYIYATVGDIFPDIEDELFDKVAPTDPNLDPTDPAVVEQKRKQITSFLNETLLIERRTVGWSSADLGNVGDSEGLIHFFEYDWADDNSTGETPIPWRSRIQKVAEGVKQGKSGTKYYTLQTFYDDDTPTDPVANVQFLAPSPTKLADYDQLDPTKFAVHRTVIKRSEPSGEDDLPVTEWPVKKRLQVGPPRHLRPQADSDPSNQDWYYPVQAQFFDPDTGISDWSAEGLVTNWSLPVTGSNDQLERLIFTYSHYEHGQLKYSVVDAVPNENLTSSHDKETAVPDWPVSPGWSRLPAAGDPPLEYVTYYEYNGSTLTDIYFPNGRRWARREVIVAPAPENPIRPQDNRVNPGNDPCGEWDVGLPDDPWFLRVFIFNDLEDVDGHWVARSTGEVHEYPGLSATGQPISTMRVEFLSGQDPDEPTDCTSVGDAFISQLFFDNSHQKDQPYFVPLAEKRVLPDQYGKLTDARIFERNVDGVLAPVGFQQVNDLGEVFRTRDMDGTITRITRNSLGQNLRRYVGTIDDEWVFPEDPQNPPPAGQIPQNHRNNLVLVERTEYGLSPNDAWQPTVVRTYNTNQSFQDNWHWYPYDAPPESDPHGQATRTRYDWRMRPVRVDVYAQGDPNTSAERLSTTLTVLDHADRARFTVTYGPGSSLNLGTNLDPTQFGPNPSLPSAADFIQGAGLTPISVVEMRYGPDGQMTERREYDVSWDGQGEPPFHADFQYTGFGGQTVFQQRPNSGVQISELDGLGRVISSATVVPRGSGPPIDYELEVARTDYVYDPDNNVQEVHRWERVVDAASLSPTDDKLGFHNAVRSTTLNWHDVQNRLVATAEVGTGHNAFVSTDQNPIYTWFDPTERPHIDPDASQASDKVDRKQVPNNIPLTIYSYDRDGNQDFVAQTIGDGTGTEAEYFVTRYTYTGLKHVATKIENYFAPEAEQRRTDYVYRFGRLAEIIADPDSSGTALQRTVVDFGADAENDWGAEVVDVGPDNTGWSVVSRHGEHVKSLRMPSLSAANEASATPSIVLRYDFQGRVAERIDARGVAIRYRHDELGRLASLEVGHYDAGVFVAGYPDSMLLPDLQAPSDRIGYIEYTYHDDTRSFEAKAWTKKSGGVLVSHNKVEFDDRGDLAADWQSIGMEIASHSPRTSYTWDTRYTEAGVAGHRRLGSMLYPAPPHGPPSAARTVSFHYGVADSLDDRLGRLTSIATDKGPVAEVARFGHVGSSRRAWMSRGDDRILQGFGLVDDPGSLSTGIGLHSLDRFGRVTELAYNERTSSGTTGPSLVNLEYAYDIAGNRTSSVRTPRPGAASPTDTRDETNSYDPFNRLTAWLTEQTTGSGTSFVRADEWNLDLLGNWLDRASETSGSGLRTTSHFPNARNRLGQIQTHIGPPSEPSDELTVYPIYDEAGNLIFDGEFAYQYDAWNRLVQVNHVEPESDPALGIQARELVKHHTYDALGRLVRTQSPNPTRSPRPASCVPNASTTTASAASRKSSSIPSPTWTRPSPTRRVHRSSCKRSAPRPTSSTGSPPPPSSRWPRPAKTTKKTPGDPAHHRSPIPQPSLNRLSRHARPTHTHPPSPSSPTPVRRISSLPTASLVAALRHE